MSAAGLLCPVCDGTEGIIFTGNARFDIEGRSTARCERRNHHPHGQAITFFTDTGEVANANDAPWWERLYLHGCPESVRSFGAPFLSERCGVVGIRHEAFDDVPELQEHKWVFKLLNEARRADQPLVALPLYSGARRVGLELCAFIKCHPRAGERNYQAGNIRKVCGERGVYVLDPLSNPRAVVLFTGAFDAITAAWDAFEAQSEELAFASAPDGIAAEIVKITFEALYPGVPVLLCSDSDASGKKVRERLRKVAKPIQLSGCSGKDYRDAPADLRWSALLTEAEKAIQRHEQGLILGPTPAALLSDNELGAELIQRHRLMRDSAGRIYEYAGSVWVERSKEDLDAALFALDDPTVPSLSLYL